MFLSVGLSYHHRPLNVLYAHPTGRRVPLSSVATYPTIFTTEVAAVLSGLPIFEVPIHSGAFRQASPERGVALWSGGISAASRNAIAGGTELGMFDCRGS